MDNSSNGSKRTAIVIGIVVIFLVGALAVWYWGIYQPEQEAIEKARLEQIAKQEAEQKRKDEAARRKTQYDQLIINADTEFNQENWAVAQSLYSDAAALLPNQQYAQDQLTLVNAKLDEIAAREARIASGEIETISSPTGRFYVIVSSSIDGDLAMDYARKLTEEGSDVKIIQPDDINKLFHRVSVGDYETWDQAVAATSSFSSFGEEVWVLKY
ncbi:MAG: hypothetical protein ABJG47_13900 [Ekhidna sp.]